MAGSEMQWGRIARRLNRACALKEERDRLRRDVELAWAKKDYSALRKLRLRLDNLLERLEELLAPR